MPGSTSPASLQPHPPGTAPRRRRLRSAAAASLLLTVVLAGPACSGDDSEDPTVGDTLPDTTTTEPAPTTGPAPTTTTPPTPEEEVEAAYLDISESYFRRLEAPDPEDPTIAKNHTGESLEVVVTELEGLARSGQAAVYERTGPPTPQIQSIALSNAGTAIVKTCTIDDAQIIELATGETVNDEVVSRQGLAMLKLRSERWVLDSLSLVAEWPDRKGCDR